MTIEEIIEELSKIDDDNWGDRSCTALIEAAFILERVERLEELLNKARSQPNTDGYYVNKAVREHLAGDSKRLQSLAGEDYR